MSELPRTSLAAAEERRRTDLGAADADTSFRSPNVQQIQVVGRPPGPAAAALVIVRERRLDGQELVPVGRGRQVVDRYRVNVTDPTLESGQWGVSWEMADPAGWLESSRALS